MKFRNFVLAASLIVSTSSAYVVVTSTHAEAAAVPAVGGQRICKYFPAGRKWPYSSSTHGRWKKLTEDAPNAFDASILSLWISEHGEHKNPGRLFTRVHNECNPK